VPVAVKRKRPQYLNKQQQLELVLAAQELSELGDHGLSPIGSDDEEDCKVKTSCMDIWEDVDYLTLLKGGVLADAVNLDESKRIKRRVSNYCWKEQKLFFKNLLVSRPEERVPLVRQMHEDLGHFGEHRTLAEIRRRYFWHNRTADVKAVIRECQQCQLVKSSGSVRSGDEHLKSIPVCDLFYRVALDTVRPLPETKSGNRYILVAIDLYSKWCEAKAVANHGAKTAARFLEDEIICRYGVPKFVLTDNGGEWAAEFDVMCGDYAIQHQHTAPQWPQCNGMVERIIKTIKHGITVLAANPANVNCWDEQLAKVLFGYRCGI
jgi:transposase InsO family protein